MLMLLNGLVSRQLNEQEAFEKCWAHSPLQPPHAHNGPTVNPVDRLDKPLTDYYYSWRFSAVVASFVARSYSTLSPVSAGMGDRLWAGIPPRYVTSQLGQLSLASLWGR